MGVEGGPQWLARRVKQRPITQRRHRHPYPHRLEVGALVANDVVENHWFVNSMSCCSLCRARPLRTDSRARSMPAWIDGASPPT